MKQHRPSTVGLGYISAILLIILAIGLLYIDSIRWLVLLWSDRSYSHGYFVPLISLYLAWEQKERFKALPISPAYAVAPLLFFCCLALLIISRYSATIQLEAISLFFITPSTILYFFGWRILRAAAFPCLYLLFMLPGINELFEPFHLISQRFSAVIGAKLLGLLYPVFLDNITIQLPAISMQVARECSGVNFLISVLAIGIPLVYLTQRTWTKALMVLVIGCALTVLSNGLRVALAGVSGQCFGPELLHGPGHIFQGWFVAWFGWIALFFTNWFVAKHSSASTPLLHERWKLHVKLTDNITRTTIRSPNFFCYTTALLTVLVVTTYFASPSPAPLLTPLSSLPINLGQWSGSDAEWLPGEKFFPGSDNELQRIYHLGPNKESLHLFIAYYETQTEESRLVSRFSRPLHKGATSINLPPLGTPSLPEEINRATLDLAGKSYDTFFWYQFPKQQTVIDRNKARLTTLQNGITTLHNNGAFVLIAVDKASDNAPPENEQALFLFMKDVGGALGALFP